MAVLLAEQWRAPREQPRRLEQPWRLLRVRQSAPAAEPTAVAAPSAVARRLLRLQRQAAMAKVQWLRDPRAGQLRRPGLLRAGREGGEPTQARMDGRMEDKAYLQKAMGLHPPILSRLSQATLPWVL